MTKLKPAIAALSIVLLSACTGQGQAGVDNTTGNSEGNAPENAAPSHPAGTGEPANAAVEPVPPPDAVSHPNGYLPPAPAEPDPAAANSSAPDSSPPATEDEYMRNRQAGR
jgi:uncharacterized lipoprotein